MSGLKQFIGFCIVGVFNLLVSYTTYSVLISFEVGYILANFFAFIIGTLNAYIFNRIFVFKIKNKQKNNSVLKIFITYGTTLLLGSVLLVFWIEVLGIPSIIAPLLNLFITTPINFLLNKFWVFLE